MMPFIIDEAHKAFYYCVLARFDTERGYLLETCRSVQDRYRELAQVLGVRKK
jgi:hypothetical protein